MLIEDLSSFTQLLASVAEEQPGPLGLFRGFPPTCVTYAPAGALELLARGVGARATVGGLCPDERHPVEELVRVVPLHEGAPVEGIEGGAVKVGTTRSSPQSDGQPQTIPWRVNTEGHHRG